MKKILGVCALGLFCHVTAFADEAELKLPYSRFLECKATGECSGNEACQIEVAVSFSDWADKKPSIKALVSWAHAPSVEPDGWIDDDKMIMDATVVRKGSDGFEVTTLTDLPGITVLTIDNVLVGGSAVGKLALRPTKIRTYQCRRFKDPK